MPMALPSTIYKRTAYGFVLPVTTTQPIEFPYVKFGDGLEMWEGTTNLVVNPTFENATPLTGYVTTGSSTLAADNAHIRGGTAAAKVALGASGSATATGIGWSVGVGVLANTTAYVFSVWVFNPTGNGVANGLELSVQGAIVASTVTSSVTTTKDGWTRLTFAFTSAAAAASNSGTIYVLNGGACAAGEIFWTDQWQLEAKAFSTPYCDGSLGSGYSWSGTAHASTSTRTAAVLTFAAPIQTYTALTMCVWAVATRNSSDTTRGVSQLISLGATANDEMSIYFNSSTNNLTARKTVGGTAVSAAPTPTYVIGDTIFIAATYDGANLKLYYSINGAAVPAPTTTATVTVPATPTLVTVGCGISATQQMNCSVEQALIFNAALNATDIAALAAATTAQDFLLDPRCVFQAAGAGTRGILKAISYAGADQSWYPLTGIPAGPLEAITSFPSLPVPAGTTYKISAQANSGLGIGDVISYTRTLPAVATYTILGVNDGTTDELYVKQN